MAKMFCCNWLCWNWKQITPIIRKPDVRKRKRKSWLRAVLQAQEDTTQIWFKSSASNQTLRALLKLREGRERERERENGECERTRVCVCEREREGEREIETKRERESICVWERGREHMCVKESESWFTSLWSSALGSPRSTGAVIWAFLCAAFSNPRLISSSGPDHTPRGDTLILTAASCLITLTRASAWERVLAPNAILHEMSSNARLLVQREVSSNTGLLVWCPLMLDY